MYLYCLDLWPESMRDNISDTNSLPYRLLTRWCQKLYNGAAKIGVTSPAFQDYLHEICLVPRENITYLPQHGEDMLRWGSLEATDNGVTDFVFMGNVGVAQDLENVARAVSLIRTPKPFLVHIVGIGPDLENLKKTVAQLGVADHFQFHGRHPLEKMPDFYRLADACLLTLYADTAAGLTIPGKLQGYMSAGKPVIAAIGGGAAQVIAQSGCGLCAQPGKPEELAEIMTQFMEQPSQAAQMGKRGRKYFEKHFSLDIFTAQLERQLEGASARIWRKLWKPRGMRLKLHTGGTMCRSSFRNTPTASEMQWVYTVMCCGQGSWMKRASAAVSRPRRSSAGWRNLTRTSFTCTICAGTISTWGCCSGI